MKWLICGSGFLGTEFSSYMQTVQIPPKIHRNLRHAHEIVDSETEFLIEWLKICQTDIFVNASGPSNVSDSFTNREIYELSPLSLCVAHIRVLSRLANPPTYVYVSSAAVYGETSSQGASESSPKNPVSPYGIGKLKAEEFLMGVSARVDFPIIILRVFSSYSNRLRARLPFVIVERFANSNHHVFDGTGSELRDFVHSKDIVGATSFITNQVKSETVSVWNIGSGLSISVADISAMAANEYLSSKRKSLHTIAFNGKIRKWDPRFLTADISKLIQAGFSPSIDPNIGLADYFRSFADEY